MELDGRGVVVTGAGRGIGAALARRFAAHGARVVVNDLDADAARTVADEVGGLAAPGDASSEAGVGALIATAAGQLGTVDVYCANAGVAEHGGPDASEAAWQRSWDVNVAAHIRAARLLVPGWLTRGGGRFLATVSAAGLLTQIGSAPYAVTKHAALAFAEWMAMTYGDRGIVTQAICPQGVRTDMLAASGDAVRTMLDPDAIDPDDVADAVIAGLDDDRFLILPHPQVAEYERQRAADHDRWLRGMRRLRDRVAGDS